MADRGEHRRAPRVLQQLLARPRAQQPEPAGVVGREPVGPGAYARVRAANRQRAGLPALPRRQLSQRRLRPGQEVHRRPLERRPQIDAHLRGRRPPRAQVRLALRGNAPSIRTATTRARWASAGWLGTTSRRRRLQHVWTFFTLQGRRAAVSVRQPSVRSARRARTTRTTQGHVSNFISAFFLQDSYSPRPQPDDQRRRALRDAEDVRQPERRVPRLRTTCRRASAWCGIRPTTAVRRSSRTIGQYYETIPLNLAARYFGGEGILMRGDRSRRRCTNPPANWTGGPGEWRTCTPEHEPRGYSLQQRPELPGAAAPQGPVPQRDRRRRAARGHRGSGAGDRLHAPLARQRHRGRHRRPTATFVLANPGNVPTEAITAYQNQITQYTAQVRSARRRSTTPPMPPTRPTAQAALAQAQNQPRRRSRCCGNLKGLASGAQARAHLRRASRCPSTSASRSNGWSTRRTPTRA